MIKINLICVGNLKEIYWSNAFEEYKKRLSRFCDFKLIELEEKNEYKNAELILKKEEAMLLPYTSDFCVLLDIKGKEYTSEDLATYISSLTINGISKINFIIGSSNGVSKTLRDTIKNKLSMSKLTFPHQLARVMLVEQLYRAFCILNNVTYHK